MKNIHYEAVIAPESPATATQIKKNILTFFAQTISEMHNDHINPAAKNPLYNPWFPAITFVASNDSLGNDLKTFGPRVVQANISKYRK